MISIKKYLLILFCLLFTGLTHCANSQQETTYPEIEGYTTEVQISDYFHMPIPDGAIYRFSDHDDFLSFDHAQNGYKKDLKIDKLEFMAEDRKKVLETSTTQIMKGGDDYVVDLTKLSHLSVGQTGYMFICFKNPKNNNKKTYIKLHIKRIED